jgi:hypothetical protein
VAEQKYLETCFVCKAAFQFGPHAYRGRRVPAWNMMVCNDCYDGNWDGIVPAVRPHLIPYLESLGLTVKHNAKGWIDWPK